VRRPISASTGTALSSEQVSREMRYIRRDLLKLLITTGVVLLFIIAANLAIN